MSIFDLRHLIIEEYGKYVQGFFSITDEGCGNSSERRFWSSRPYGLPLYCR